MNNFADEVTKILKANRDSYVINDDMKITDPIILEEKFPDIVSQISTLHEKEIAFLNKVIKAKDKFLIAYRLGPGPSTKPPEWAFEACEKYNKYLKEHNNE
jgi:hypothetical protein